MYPIETIYKSLPLDTSPMGRTLQNLVSETNKN